MYRITLALLLAPTSLVAEVIDFETADLVAAPRGWTISMTHEGGAPCWEIARDPTSPGGVKVLAQLSDDRTSGRFPLAIYDSASLANGEIGVKFKPISGRVDQAAGLVWRYADENNYYIVRANALENNVVLYKVENGRRSSLSPVGRSGDYGVKHTVPSQQWSTLGVVFSDSRFTVLFGGQKLFQVEDSTFSEAGRVGLWTKADSVTYFDDFEIVNE
ncbi:MAG: hypothetical protein H0W33_07590 [Gammaproteobacteria bacterium]|nr:hypothetical protein [Gammaproteobacteria bacterium]